MLLRIALSTLLLTAACTGQDPGEPDDDSSSTTSATEAPTPTPSPVETPVPCAPSCDTPEAVAFDGNFAVVDDGNGGFSANGTLGFDFYDFDGVSLSPQPICRQSWGFSADWATMASAQGCAAGGVDCVSVCPFDAPGDLQSPGGACVGHLKNIVPDLTSFVSDCVFEDPRGWFHPEAPANIALNEQWLYSYPVETLIPTGAASPTTWGEWENLVTDFGSPFENWLPDMQIGFVNRDQTSGLYNNSAFLFGITVMNPGTGTPNDRGIGEHSLVNLFVLVFQ